MRNSGKKNVLDPFSFGGPVKVDSKILFDDNAEKKAMFIDGHGKSIVSSLASVDSQVKNLVNRAA